LGEKRKIGGHPQTPGRMYPAPLVQTPLSPSNLGEKGEGLKSSLPLREGLEGRVNFLYVEIL